MLSHCKIIFVDAKFYASHHRKRLVNWRLTRLGTLKDGVLTLTCGLIAVGAI